MISKKRKKKLAHDTLWDPQPEPEPEPEPAEEPDPKLYVGPSHVWDKFLALYPDVPPNQAPASSWLDDTEALHAHVRVYAFADYHDIASLQILALRNVHRILAKLVLSERRMESFVELVRYCYEHTRADESERLRSMISTYAACKAEELWRSQSFQSLVATTGDFSADLVGKMLGRLPPNTKLSKTMPGKWKTRIVSEKSNREQRDFN